MDKFELRKLYIEKRKKLNDNEKIQADLLIAQRFLSSVSYKKAATILCYVSNCIEVDTLRIIRNAFLNGKNVAVPRCVEGTNEMHFQLINSLDELQKGSYNILEPKEDEKRVVKDFTDCVCVVPALAFDLKGYRLGYGKGFYDRFLTENSVVSVGICYDSFISSSLPRTENDICINKIFTECRTIGGDCQ